MQQDIYDPTKPFNEQTRKLIQDTHPTDGPIVLRPHGKRFAIVKDSGYWKDYDEQRATDGIGTKGLLYWLMFNLTNDVHYVARGVHDGAAMVFDDLAEGGYEPYELEDHIMMQEEREDAIFALTRELRDLCIQHSWEVYSGRMNPVIISGGETAIINTLQGFEMGINATGKVKKGEEIISCAKAGDVAIGMGSSGLHSNGYTFLRDEFFEKRRWKIDQKLPYGPTIGEELTIPTRMYLPALKELRNYRQDIHGMVHITGGAFTKLRELMPDRNVDIGINRTHCLIPHQIFHYAYQLGTPSEKMYSRFNCGIGYVVVVSPLIVDNVLPVLRRYFPADVIGDVREGSGRVLIESQFEDKTIVYR